MDITHTAMLTALSVSKWGARKFDKTATKEVHDWHQVSEDTGRYTKRLLSKDCAVYNAIGNAESKGRKHFYEQTLPWNDMGWILPAANFLTFNEIMKQDEAEWEATLPPFFEQYPWLKRQAQVDKKTLYREEDWPDIYKLKKSFSWELDFWPVPDAADFRVDISAEQAELIKAQITKDVHSSIDTAMQEPYRRLWDGVAHMAARLSEAKTCPCRKCKGKEYKTGVFQDTLITGVIDLCETLPRLNLTGDAYLTDMIELVKTSLTEFQPDVIRESDPIRKSLAERAKEIQEDLAGWMQAS